MYLETSSTRPIPVDSVGYRRKITPLPGEVQFKGRFKPFDLQFKPIASFDPRRAKEVAMQEVAASVAKPSEHECEDNK